jgi:hypothetical protein
MRAFNRATQFAEFTPLPPTQQELESAKSRDERMKVSNDDYIRRHNFRLLKTDYYNGANYYYDPKNNYIWEVSYIKNGSIQRPTREVSNHIRELNGIALDSYYGQPLFINV